MVVPEIVSRKVAHARHRLESAEALAARAQETDSVADRDLASFYVFLAIQEGIDLAAHWVADEGWPSPNEAGDAFIVLGDHGLIDRETAVAMREAVGLRNRIAHLYGSIDHQRLFAEMTAGARYLRLFLIAVANAAGV